MSLYYQVTINGKEMIFENYDEIASFCENNNTEPTELYKCSFDTDTFKFKKDKLI